VSPLGINWLTLSVIHFLSSRPLAAIFFFNLASGSL